MPKRRCNAMKVCISCGIELADRARYCSECGKSTVNGEKIGETCRTREEQRTEREYSRQELAVLTGNEKTYLKYANA